MARRRKFLVYVATSADGYIARRDGSVDWLDRPRPPGNYGMDAFLRSIDTILWGRTTWEQGLAMGVKEKGFGSGIRNYVFSHHPPASPVDGVVFVHEPVREFAERLRAEPGKDVWMMGGAGLIGSFLDAGEVDELIVHVVPVLIGEGIPLVPPARRMVELELRSVRRFSDGVVRYHYAVARTPAAPTRVGPKSRGPKPRPRKPGRASGRPRTAGR